MDSFFGELIKLGLSGLVIYVVAAPLIKYLIDRSKKQDEWIKQLVNDHLKQDNERHVKVISSLEHVEHNLGNLEKVLTKMPDTMLDRASKVYPPLPSQATPVTVNVAQPGPVVATK